MLAKKHRLNLKESHNRELFARGLRWRQGFLQAWYDFRGQSPQVAVIAPKAVVPKSSARNALRRAAFSALPADWLATKNLQLVVRATHAKASDLTQAELKTWFAQLFAEIKKNAQ